MRILDHRRSAAFGLIGLPDWAGLALACEARLASGDAPLTDGTAQGFGRYYASALRFMPREGETAVLFLGRVRQDDRWRIFWYKLIEP